MFHDFIPKELALSEDVIGCLSDAEVHIFKVKFSNPDGGGGDLGSGGHRSAMRSISVYRSTDEMRFTVFALSKVKEMEKLKKIVAVSLM